MLKKIESNMMVNPNTKLTSSADIKAHIKDKQKLIKQR